MWVGLPTALLCTGLVIRCSGKRVTRLTIGAALMVFTALHIHQGYGVTELHFGVFVLLAVLLCYRDWGVIAVAAVIIAVHHLLFNYLQTLGFGTICFSEPGLGRVLAHAAYVVAESTALCFVAAWLHKDALQAGELRTLVQGLSEADEKHINLVLPRSSPSSPAATALFNALNMVSEAVGAVRRGAHFMATAANELVAGAIDLRQGMVRQSEEVDDMASSMQVLTDIASTTQAHTAKAADYVGQVEALTAKSDTAMQDAVEVMGSVHGSAGQINQITEVIDGIAFQTNILALNASVEAARAGEQGKGFAVVAAEVRVLAQRCAEAAGQIRVLVESSTDEIGRGNRLVSTAGQLLDELDAQVRHLSAAFAQVLEDNQRQMSHLNRLQTAMRRVAELVRHNMHTAREDQDSAIRLEEEVRNLTKAISQFRL